MTKKQTHNMQKGKLI